MCTALARRLLHVVPCLSEHDLFRLVTWKRLVVDVLPISQALRLLGTTSGFRNS